MFLFKKVLGIGSLRTGARFTALIDMILGCFFIYLGVMCNNIFRKEFKGHVLFVSILCFMNGILSIILSMLLIASAYKQHLKGVNTWVLLKLFILFSFPIIAVILIEKQINEDFSIGIIIATIFLFILLNVFVMYLWVCMFFYYFEMRSDKFIADHLIYNKNKNLENNELALVYRNDECEIDQARLSGSSYRKCNDEQQKVIADLDDDDDTVEVVKVIENVVKIDQSDV